MSKRAHTKVNEMTEQTIDRKNPGMVFMKTASQTGEDKVFDTYSDYMAYMSEHPQAHKIIEVQRVPELAEADIEILNDFGSYQIFINGEKSSISKIFGKYWLGVE